MFRFGWLTVTAEDLAVWEKLPNEAFSGNIGSTPRPSSSCRPAFDPRRSCRETHASEASRHEWASSLLIVHVQFRSAEICPVSDPVHICRARTRLPTLNWA